MPKGRESEMPAADYWESFFDARCILSRFGCNTQVRNIVEFGCGYGTFTIPAAQVITGTVFAADIDPEMVSATQLRAQHMGVKNVSLQVRDFLTEGTGLGDDTADLALLFNILHIEEAADLLRESYRILRPGGVLGILHWRLDIQTPRGPSLVIRPSLEQSQRWSERWGFHCDSTLDLPCAPWHWGLTMLKPAPD